MQWQHPIWVLICAPTVLLPIYIPDNGLRKAKKVPIVENLVTPMGDPDKALDS